MGEKELLEGSWEALESLEEGLGALDRVRELALGRQLQLVLLRGPFLGPALEIAVAWRWTSIDRYRVERPLRVLVRTRSLRGECWLGG